jgi:hypothetical protein
VANRVLPVSLSPFRRFGFCRIFEKGEIFCLPRPSEANHRDFARWGKKFSPRRV